MLLHPRELLRRRAGEEEVVVLVHEREHVGEGAGALADRLAHRPQPGRVDVRVADGDHVVGARVGGGGEQGSEHLAAGLRRAGDVVGVEGVDEALEPAEDLRAPGRLLAELAPQAVEGPHVLRQLPHGQVAQADVEHPGAVDGGVAGGGEVAHGGGRVDRLALHVRVRRRLDVEVDAVAWADLQRHRRVAGLDGLQDVAFWGPDEALGLEAGVAAHEAEVDEHLDACIRHLPVGWDGAGDVEPRGSPRAAPLVTDPEGRELLGDRLGEGHGLARNVPGGDGELFALAVDGGGESFGHEPADAEVDELRGVRHGAPFCVGGRGGSRRSALDGAGERKRAAAEAGHEYVQRQDRQGVEE